MVADRQLFEAGDGVGKVGVIAQRLGAVGRDGDSIDAFPAFDLQRPRFDHTGIRQCLGRGLSGLTACS